MQKEKKIIPRNLPGFEEYLPEDQIVFNKYYDTIRKSYEKFGFIPIDTPVIEYSDVLLAKAGGETEKQIYRFTKGDTDMSLRFDLTVPLAKYVAKNTGNLTFPFRRYQIGKVYRGEKAQRGRYREFYQADIDVIGDDELPILTDAEIPAIIYDTFKSLGFDNFVIKINNRKLLNGFFESLDISDTSEVLRIVDKIDKVGNNTVTQMLKELKITDDKIEKILKFITYNGSNMDKLEYIESLNILNNKFIEGRQELKTVIEGIRFFLVPEINFEIDFKIARGLDYYTGTIYETILTDYKELGSVCSGGRYEGLAKYYTNKKLPGVGISIGLTRLIFGLKEVGYIKSNEATNTKIMIIPMCDKATKKSFEIATLLRNSNINTEVNYYKKNLKSSLNYANKLKIPYVLFIGEDELKTEKYTIKNMYNGDQEIIPINQIVSKLS